MNYHEFLSSVEDAEKTLRRADEATRKLAPLMAGRLKKGSHKDDEGWEQYPNALAELKRELRDFDLRTLKWKK